MHYYLKSLQKRMEELVINNIPERTPLFWTKSDGSSVSSVDLVIQKELIAIIERKYPDHRILYEEGEQLHLCKPSDFTWIIDPIDGTTNFLKGKKSIVFLSG